VIQSPTKIAEEAYAAYAQSDWKKAVQDYRSLYDRGIADPALLYNLGTAYARAGEKGRAILMLLKAERLAPRDRDIQDNLKRLAPEVSSQIAIFPVPPLQAFYNLFALNEWAWIAALATTLSAMIWSIFFLIPRDKRGRWFVRRCAITVLIVAALAHVFAGVKYYYEAYMSRGVVITADVRPHEAPDDSSPTSEFVLPQGTVIKISDAGVGGWVKATYSGRNEVFIHRDQMEFL